ncbi:hypothetical protein [Streptomyces marispadix]|uniref:Uncharacterized protein n=1 Tax=Streptomyces marispadix TaxID=2922868 RepID=A0ABS9T356_9ACTN|nr:hypothetical protein [Streptomyces marispadix]MCH6162957.1 hypothetical protein [Streptomyces marispadix]
MGDQEQRPPLAKVAFDDLDTQTVWKATRRRVRLRLWLWSALLVAALALSGLLADVRWDDGGARGDNSVGGVVGGLAVLGYPFALYTCCGALSRLRRARSVLEAYPWQSIPAARKLSGTKEARGVAVQLRLPGGAHPGGGESAYADEDGTLWSQSLSARDPLRWNRWATGLEEGAWFAGDVERGGVLALPGPRGLMTVQRRSQVLSMEGRTARAEHESILAAAPGRG